MLRILASLGFFCMVVIFWLLLATLTLLVQIRKTLESQRKLLISQQPAPPPKPRLFIVRLPAKDAEEEFCKCGNPGCLGHEVQDKEPVFPGLTSEVVLAQMMQRGIKFIRYTQEVTHQG